MAYRSQHDGRMYPCGPGRTYSDLPQKEFDKVAPNLLD